MKHLLNMPTKWGIGLLAIMAALPGVAAEGTIEAPLLERDVLPILQKNCMGCHGGLKQKRELDLRTLPSMLKGGKGGPAVVAGKPAESALWQSVAEDEMPKEKPPLSAKDKGVLKNWISAGLPTLANLLKKYEKPLLPADEKHEPRVAADAVDGHVSGRLAHRGLKAAEVAEDAEFLRRLYLDLNGRVPTPEQATAFLDSAAPGKRAKLIDELLASPEFGNHFGRTWREWICPPELPSDMNSGRQPVQQSRDLGKWLARQFNENATWDKLVRDILTVKGEIKNQPQLIFYGLVGQNARATPSGSTRTIGSLFMGVQLQCAQCHDDPFRDWAQNEFWGLAGFFNGMTGDFSKVQSREVHGQVSIPETAFFNAGTKVPVSFLRGTKPDAKRKTDWRPVFVDWLTRRENPFFARAFANRLWFQLFTRGIVHPVDDMRALNPPTHPGLLNLLTNEFAASGFDVKHLLRCICNSQTYQRTSRGRVAQQQELFGRAPVRVMTADMLLESLKIAYGDPKLDLRTHAKDDGNTNGESAAVGDEYMEFHRRFGTNEEDATDFTHGIPQMLTFINHPRLREGGRFMEDWLKKNPDLKPEAMIERLYLSTLSRRPTTEELAEAAAYTAGGDEPKQAYTDVLWMLVNRSEYLFVR
jgi:hypothetical protein